MNKRVDKKREVVIDDKEDLEIRKVAYSKESSQTLLLGILIILFGLTFFSSISYIFKYYADKNINANELIEINTNYNKVLITNNGEITENIKDSKEENIEIEKINTLEINTNKNAKEASKIYIDIKYNILENNFPNNLYASKNSDVLVKFSYSYNREDWTDIKNVISTTDSTISPLVGNYYDIAGIVSNLKVTTNFEVSSKPGETTTIYWKCKTIIKKNENNLNKNFKANFKIEYKDNA